MRGTAHKLGSYHFHSDMKFKKSEYYISDIISIFKKRYIQKKVTVSEKKKKRLR